jgi:nitroreductase
MAATQGGTVTFSDLVRSRYSVRAFQNRPVEREKLDAVLEAGRLAPSACNRQPWRFVVLETPEDRARLAACYGRDWFRTAPAAIVLCGLHAESWKRGDGKDHADIDVAIAADHMTLAAAELGLGTCWICAFDPERLRKLLALPPDVEPIVLLPIGYPAAPPAEAHGRRKSLREVVQRGLDA